MKATKEAALEFLSKHRDQMWYHRIELADGIFTPCSHIKPEDTVETSSWLGTWDAMESKMRSMDLVNKRVMDIGCRDGKFSYLAEELGAASVLGVDSDILPVMTELSRLLGSDVVFEECNVYDIGSDQFNVILCFGILYHLRFPFLALKRLVDSLYHGGVIAIETGIFQDRNTLPILYCPVDGSPYEPTSCSFFNFLALSETMKSMGMEEVSMEPIGFATGGKLSVIRALCVFRKTGKPIFEDYWYGTHKRHTEGKADPAKI